MDSGGTHEWLYRIHVLGVVRGLPLVRMILEFDRRFASFFKLDGAIFVVVGRDA